MTKLLNDYKKSIKNIEEQLKNIKSPKYKQDILKSYTAEKNKAREQIVIYKENIKKLEALIDYDVKTETDKEIENSIKVLKQQIEDRKIVVKALANYKQN